MEFTSAWVDRNEQIRMVRKTLPKPKANEVVVRIKACGICGTDIHFVKDLPAGTLTPLGHEVAGYIHEVGSPFPGLNVGDSVVVENNIACGRCEQCLNQKPQACENIYSYMDDQAGMGQFLVVPREMVIPYEGLDYPEATLAEPITVALDLSREAAIELFDDVLIMGPGIIGLSCIKLAKLRGARNVVMVGHHLDTPRGAYRGEVARKLGADLVIDSAKTGWKDELKQQFPKLFKRVIVTSPPATLGDGIELAGFCSSIVYDGIDFKHDQVTFSANEFHFAKKRLIASHAIPNWGFPQAFELLKQGHIPSSLLLTHLFTMDEVDEAFAVFGNKEEQVIKPVILID
ncbi:alcohol dehydrogenase catalytic domain-containing protein [uncultured Sphaerochaeta sp.]|uniref:zinc-dependent alcohol dehydrogenase n=1 Tax=uncultured Sphaerochaeta sp. TaxID=886478 RepID=UPI002AA84E67|nr:alcohol dehydrogenase catalytic domain-containing protein [uncultured Sphaerochaeta sp.]